MGVTRNQQQQNHHLRTDSSLSHWGGGVKCILLVPNLRPRFCCCWSTRNVQLTWRPSNYCNVSSCRNTLIKLTHYDETKKRAHRQSELTKTSSWAIARLIPIIKLALVYYEKRERSKCDCIPIFCEIVNNMFCIFITWNKDGPPPPPPPPIVKLGKKHTFWHLEWGRI